MPRPESSRGTTLFPKSQACPCPFIDLFLERLVPCDDAFTPLEELYQAYRGLLWQLERAEDVLGSQTRLGRALAKSPLRKVQRNRQRGYCCLVTHCPVRGFSLDGFGHQFQQVIQGVPGGLPMRKVRVAGKLHAVANCTIRDNEIVCQLRGEVTSTRTSNQRRRTYIASGLPGNAFVPLRQGYRLDPLVERIEDNAGMWPQRGRHFNVQKVRIYEGDSFKGVYWVAVKNIFVGEEVIGDPVRVKEVLL